MIRRPPRSTLFPTRRSSDLHGGVAADHGQPVIAGWHHVARSEEYTSELQSRVDLVCRLLLEKKKNATTYCAGGSFNAETPRGSIHALEGRIRASYPNVLSLQ